MIFFPPDSYWTGTGPLFFYTGNEGPIEEFYLNTGFLFVLAQEFKALVVFAEHVRGGGGGGGGGVEGEGGSVIP